jgi:tellurite resistance-related uncharacterized protein
MKTLPSNVTSYKRTPVFTQDSVPPGLLHNHNTKDGVWGLIQVTQGQLEYTIGTEDKYILTPGQPGVVEPQVIHHVRPLTDVTFFVEFYK